MDGSPCSILMRFYAALIASLLSNQSASCVITAAGVSPTWGRELAEKNSDRVRIFGGVRRTHAAGASYFGNEVLLD